MITENGNILQITLTSADASQEIEVQYQLNGQTPREFIIGNNSVMGGAKVIIEKWLSDHTGWTPYVNPANGARIEFASKGAGYAMTFYQKVGKIRFVAIDATETTDIKIDLIK